MICHSPNLIPSTWRVEPLWELSHIVERLGPTPLKEWMGCLRLTLLYGLPGGGGQVSCKAIEEFNTLLEKIDKLI